MGYRIPVGDQTQIETVIVPAGAPLAISFGCHMEGARPLAAQRADNSQPLEAEELELCPGDSELVGRQTVGAGPDGGSLSRCPVADTVGG